jgi:hypothetical protein
MPNIYRKDFSGGWNPSADDANCSDNLLMRADNVMLDDQGILALRPGSEKMNVTPYAETDIHSLYACRLNGVEHIFAGASNNIYDNNTSLGQTLAGTGKISFGSQFGQVFMARSTSKLKYSGTAVTNWGIAAPNAVPTIAAVAADYIVFATCATAESPAFSANEGTINATYPTGQDGVVTGAIEVTPDSTSGRAVITKTFAAETDYTAYAGGDTGTDLDLFEFFVYLTEPELLQSLTVMVDVNSSSTNRFQDDYFFYEFKYGEEVTIQLNPQAQIDRIPDTVPQHVRDYIENQIRSHMPEYVTTFRRDKPASNAGWNHFSIPRGEFKRIGSTTGKGWNTVKALRLVALNSAGGAASIVRYDDIRFTGGATKPLMGDYTYKYVFVNNLTNYQAKSAPSGASTSINFKGQSSTVTIPAGALAAMDGQVDEIWVYRLGGMMNQYYRVATTTDVTTPVVITDTLSDLDAMVLNLTLEYDNVPPPDSIVGIEGPYYSRMFCLTATHIYPSRINNPESYSSGQYMRVGDGTDTAYWITQALGGLYIGTAKDIYRLDGTGSELADGTIDFNLIPLNIGSPPVNDGFTRDGNRIYYCAADGWRLFNGVQSVSLLGNLELLTKGTDRYGVSNLSFTSLYGAEPKAAVFNNQLVSLMFELDDVDPYLFEFSGTTKVYRCDLGNGQWTRSIYPVEFKSIAKRPDGSIIAGDNAGTIWNIDSQETVSGDSGTDIPITLWTKRFDNGQPLQRKDPWEITMKVASNSHSASVAIHLDGSDTATQTKTITSTGGITTYQIKLDDLTVFKNIQFRITSTTDTFKLYEFNLAYRERPQLQVWSENKPLVRSNVRRRFGGFNVQIDTLGGPAAVTPVLDDTDQTIISVTTTDVQGDVLTLSSAVGRDLWAKIAKTTGFELYAIEPIVLETLPPQFKGQVPYTDAGYPCEKVMNSINIKACTLGVARTFTVYIDEVSAGTFSMTTSLAEPETYTHPFTSLQTGKLISFSVDGDIELYSWSPNVLYKLPCWVYIWDTGYVDTGTQDITWFREIKIKAKAPGPLTVIPYFDDVAFAPYTTTSEGSVVTIYSVPVGREYKGRQPRVMIQSSTLFQPYWVEFYFRTTGDANKKSIRVKVG